MLAVPIYLYTLVSNWYDNFDFIFNILHLLTASDDVAWMLTLLIPIITFTKKQDKECERNESH